MISPTDTAPETPGYAVECPDNCSTRLRARTLERFLARRDALLKRWIDGCCGLREEALRSSLISKTLKEIKRS
jgi:hypothetical protein